MDEPRKIAWQDIAALSPAVPGVYAWYFAPRFSDYDLSRLEEKLQQGAGPSAVEDFLRRHLFKYLTEEPYDARIRGPLKAEYGGKLHHRQQISSELLQRLSSESGRCRELASILPRIAPLFCAPLYIGMAKESLKKRLLSHKVLIQSMYEGATPRESPAEDDRRDASFARSVHERGIPTDQLFVQVLPLENNQIAVDVENILNRLSYPVLGRN